jgi:hypothetical protein
MVIWYSPLPPPPLIFPSGETLETPRTIIWRRQWLIHSPKNLESVWVRECAKFFDPAVLQAKPWTLLDWRKDQSIQTVWVVSDSIMTDGHLFWKTIDSELGKLKLLCLLADEAHIAFRSITSQRAKIHERLLTVSEFSLFVTGTPFPLSPSIDGAGVLRHVGGPFTEQGKWNINYRRAFHRLFEVNDEWDILCFRALLSTICLRRTLDSTWRREWIIERAVARPTPIVVPPDIDRFSKRTASQLRKNVAGFNELNTRQRMERADLLRYIAWGPEIFDLISERIPDGKMGGTAANVKVFEDVMSNITKYPPSGRVKKLVGLIKAARERGRGVIIVSDRIYLVALAYAVSLSSFVN